MYYNTFYVEGIWLLKQLTVTAASESVVAKENLSVKCVLALYVRINNKVSYYKPPYTSGYSISVTKVDQCLSNQVSFKRGSTILVSDSQLHLSRSLLSTCHLLQQSGPAQLYLHKLTTSCTLHTHGLMFPLLMSPFLHVVDPPEADVPPPCVCALSTFV